MYIENIVSIFLGILIWQYVTCIDISLSPRMESVTRNVGSNFMITCTLKFGDTDEINLDDLKSKWDGLVNSATDAKVKNQIITTNAKDKSISSRVRWQKATADLSGEYKCKYEGQSKQLSIKFNEPITFNDSVDAASNMALIRNPGETTTFVCKATPDDGSVQFKWNLPDGAPDGASVDGKFYPDPLFIFFVNLERY